MAFAVLGGAPFAAARMSSAAAVPTANGAASWAEGPACVCWKVREGDQRAPGGPLRHSPPLSPSGRTTRQQPQPQALILDRAEPVSSPELDAVLKTLKWDARGLVVAIAQHADTGDVLMQGFADADALSATFASRRATFYSRSRKSLWTKGESSRNFITVLDIFVDCDRDTVIYMGIPDGPTCHTGEITCFFSRLDDEVDAAAAALASAGADADLAKLPKLPPRPALTTLFSLEHTIEERKRAAEAAAAAAAATARDPAAPAPAKPSWTQKLLGDPKLLCSKIREEADELCRTLEDAEGGDRAASEMADVLYHSLVLLSLQGVKVEDVLAKLRTRFSKSGIEEKASRAAPSVAVKPGQ